MEIMEFSVPGAPVRLIMPVISSFFKPVLEKLASEAWTELGLDGDVKEDLRKLQMLLSTLKHLAEVLEKRPVVREAAHKWFERVREAALDADDVVEELQNEAMRRRMESRHHLSAKIKVRNYYFSTPSSQNRKKFHHEVGKKLKHVTNILVEMEEEGKNYYMSEGPIIYHPEEQHIHSGVVESQIYGRDREKEMVVNFLLREINVNEPASESILTIQGPSGVGKTTLVRLACNDDRIKHHFDLRTWVDNLVDLKSLEDIQRAIIACAMKDKFDLLRIAGTLHHHLLGMIYEKRFLLILDGLDNLDYLPYHSELMEWLKSSLRVGKGGSKIILSAFSPGGRHPLLDILSKDDSWSLLREIAFASGRENETPRMVQIGREIVSKCGGLPLAVKVLGGLMGSRRGEAEWLAVKDSEIWESCPVLSAAFLLSYNAMPLYLKQCFQYCALFPKDFKFDVRRLISLWIAEGFIPVSKGGMSEEDVGNEYFNRLLSLSFFHDIEKDSYGNIVTCKMHRSVCEFACRAGGYICSARKISEDLGLLPTCRYLTLIHDSMSADVLNPSFESLKFRSFILVRQKRCTISNIRKVEWDTILCLRYLRVLALSCCKISALPSTICRLEHLRFLDLSESEIRTIPNTITSLCSLSTLILSWCLELRELPTGMSIMSNLRHLDITGCDKLTHLPPRLGRLTNLQTLPLFIVDEEDGSTHNRNTIMELHCLNQIRGRLEIKGLNNVKIGMEAKEANLAAKVNLERLDLIWGGDGENAEDVFESLRPHPDLRMLNVKGYGGIRFPSWICCATQPPSPSSFHNLVEIQLHSLKRCECLPPLGHLPSLMSLWIHDMPAIRTICPELNGKVGKFPKLSFLRFEDMPNLVEWIVEVPDVKRERMLVPDVERERMFPRLQSLVIQECPILSCLPDWLGCLTSLQSLEVYRCGNWAMLPEGVQHLSLLRQLKVCECPLLERRYERETGEDWQKISHIRNIDIISTARR